MVDHRNLRSFDLKPFINNPDSQAASRSTKLKTEKVSPVQKHALIAKNFSDSFSVLSFVIILDRYTYFM